MADDIEMSLENETGEVNMDASNPDNGEVDLDAEGSAEEIDTELEDQNVEVTLSAENTNDEVTEKIITAETASIEAVQARNEARQAAEDAETYALQTRLLFMLLTAALV